MNLKLSSVPYISSFLQSSITIPKQWINDIKLVEFEEILSSSVGALALLFRWNKVEKSEFTEIASGMLSSSFVYGDPISTIGSIASLGYAYTKTKPSPLMDNIIKDTIHRFKNPFDNSKIKWKNLHQYVVTQKISDISDLQYSDMFI